MSAAVLEPMRADEGVTVLYVSDGGDWKRVEDEAARIEERRRRHGMPVKGLAELAGVDRTYLADVLKGKRPATDTFVGKVTAALDRFEQEVGEDDANQDDLVEFEVDAGQGVTVVVKGPVRDRLELEESVVRLVSRLRQAPPEPSEPEYGNDQV